MPDFRPSTVSIMLGIPARRRNDHCPLVIRWRNLSIAVICGRNLGSHERLPIQMATGLSTLMGRFLQSSAGHADEQPTVDAFGSQLLAGRDEVAVELARRRRRRPYDDLAAGHPG